MSLAFSPDSRLLASAGDDHSIKVWDVDSGQKVQDLEGHITPVTALAFSPDGSMLASGSVQFSTTILLWDLASGEVRRTLVDRSYNINDLAFRAARLVVDTGLHTKGWTLDQAQEFMVENAGLDPGFVEFEVTRYVTWPGQATAYMVGMLKILELRQRAMDRLGDQFDLKEFHRVVLSNGSMPLEVLEREVDDYIEDRLSTGAEASPVTGACFQASGGQLPSVHSVGQWCTSRAVNAR